MSKLPKKKKSKNYSIQVFHVGEEGCPSDASKLILSGAPHDPVYNKIEKQCGHDASISDTSVDFK